MRLRARDLALVVTMACVLWASPEAVAQVPGSQLEDGMVEVGIGARFVNRDLELSGIKSQWKPQYHVVAAFLRYGVNEWFTWSTEVAAGNTHAFENLLSETTWNSRYLLVGTGVQVAFVGGERWRAIAGLHASRSGFLSRESVYCHQHDTEWLATVHVERTFEFASHEATLWGGPSVGSHRAEVYAGHACSVDADWKSVDNWGAIVGVDALWYSRVSTYAHVVYAQHFQPRVGLALRFE